MNTKDFFYDLPQEQIAQVPLLDRSKSKLLHYKKDTGEINHIVFEDIVQLLGENDVLVMNNTKVLPARIYGIKEQTGAKIELLLSKRLDINTWEVMSRPAKRAKEGSVINFGENLSAKVIKELEDGMRLVEFLYDGVFEEILDKVGIMPLPPYIKEKLEDKDRYQTVYAEELGSSAAPTAGLHFTDDILKKLLDKGVQIENVLLHVGLGTFKSVSVDDLENHKMHSEYYKIDKEVADRLNLAKKNGKRIVCVGTTSVRTLESAVNEYGKIENLEDDTDIFIYPPYKFKFVDALITNFHLPESTLIMLVSAFIDREKTLNLYETAVNNKYRFFSFGDAMFIE